MIVTVGLLVFFGLARLQEIRRQNKRNPLQCQQNLKLIGEALHEFNVDHGDKMPWELRMAEGGSLEAIPTTQATPHFRALTNFIRNTRILACPMDPVRHRGTSLVAMDDSALSYFLNVSAGVHTRLAVLAGDRTLSPSPDTTTGELWVSATTPIQWTQPVPDDPGHVIPGNEGSSGNLLFSNNSLIETTTPQLQRVVLSFGTNTQHFILP